MKKKKKPEDTPGFRKLIPFLILALAASAWLKDVTAAKQMSKKTW